MKSFDGLKAGTRITCGEYLMECLFWDYYGTGKKVMCFADGRNIYPATEFSPADWEIHK